MELLQQYSVDGTTRAGYPLGTICVQEESAVLKLPYWKASKTTFLLRLKIDVFLVSKWQITQCYVIAVNCYLMWCGEKLAKVRVIIQFLEVKLNDVHVKSETYNNHSFRLCQIYDWSLSTHCMWDFAFNPSL